jgi:hypothetical protein
MDLFPRSFLLVFQQLAVGGFLSLSIPPFHVLSRGYYQSTAFVYLAIAGLAFAGRAVLWWNHRDELRDGTMADSLQLLLWAAFILAAAGYVATLWSERVVLRARLFVCTWALGLIGLAAAAVAYTPGGSAVIELLVYPGAFFVSALLLGTVSAGMLLGHWYLIDRDLSLKPLRRMLAFFSSCLALQLGLLVLGPLLLALGGEPATRGGLQQLARDHLPFFIARCSVSPIGAGILAWMIWRTLQIPQTMAATGLFYIAILAVMVGELMGRYLLFRTGIPA